MIVMGIFSTLVWLCAFGLYRENQELREELARLKAVVDEIKHYRLKE